MITFNSITFAKSVKDKKITVPVPVKSFESMIPVLTKQFRYACRNMKNEGETEEAVQDMLALAFFGYKSLVDRKLYDNIYSTPLGDYSIRSFFAGRRSYGQSSTDVTSDRCIKLRRAKTKEIFRYNYRKHCWTEIDIYDPEPLVDFQSDLLMDFENWLETLSPQERKVADLLLKEKGTGEIAKAVGLSAGRISQLKNEFRAKYEAFLNGSESDRKSSV